MDPTRLTPAAPGPVSEILGFIGAPRAVLVVPEDGEVTEPRAGTLGLVVAVRAAGAFTASVAEARAEVTGGLDRLEETEGLLVCPVAVVSEVRRARASAAADDTVTLLGAGFDVVAVDGVKEALLAAVDVGWPGLVGAVFLTVVVVALGSPFAARLVVRTRAPALTAALGFIGDADAADAFGKGLFSAGLSISGA